MKEEYKDKIAADKKAEKEKEIKLGIKTYSLDYHVYMRSNDAGFFLGISGGASYDILI